MYSLSFTALFVLYSLSFTALFVRDRVAGSIAYIALLLPGTWGEIPCYEVEEPPGLRSLGRETPFTLGTSDIVSTDKNLYSGGRRRLPIRSLCRNAMLGICHELFYRASHVDVPDPSRIQCFGQT